MNEDSAAHVLITTGSDISQQRRCDGQSLQSHGSGFGLIRSTKITNEEVWIQL